MKMIGPRGWLALFVPVAAFIVIWIFAVVITKVYTDPFHSSAEVSGSGAESAIVFATVNTEERVVAMTFDDGPDPRWTPAVLDALTASGSTATFFVIGKNVSANADIMRDLAASGMEIANHTQDHVDFDHATRSEQLDQIRRCSQSIEAVGVEEADYIRPPKGALPFGSGRVFHEYGGRTTVLWDVSVERSDESDDQTVKRVIASVHPGSIILAHDGGIPNRAKTVRVIPRILEGLSARGYEVVSVSELLESE